MQEMYVRELCGGKNATLPQAVPVITNFSYIYADLLMAINTAIWAHSADAT